MANVDAGFGAAIPPPPRPIEYRDVDDSGWGWSIVAGVLLVGLGLWLVTNPYRSVEVLALLVGAALIVAGVVEVVAFGAEGRLGWAAWVAGAAVAAAGVAVIVWPDATLWAIAVLAGVGLVVTGVIRLAVALESHRIRPDWPLQLGLGVVSIVAGGVVLAWPDATLEVLGFLLGVHALVTGLVAIGTGWQLHRLAR